MLLAASANATARRFDIVNDAATNSEGEIELEGWVDFGRPSGAPHAAAEVSRRTNAMFWIGGRLGLLDSLELASFVVLEKRDSADPPQMLDSNDESGVMQWVTELRWRPVDVGKWPVDLFVQLQLIDWFQEKHPFQFRFTIGLSKQIRRVQLAANLSLWTSLSLQRLNERPIQWNWLEPSIAASVRLVEADGSIPAINLGVEAWSYVAIGTPIHSHLLMDGGLVVGPTVSGSRGRVWLSVHLGIPLLTPLTGNQNYGVTGPNGPLVGRLIVGVAL